MNKPASIWDIDLFCLIYYRDLINPNLDEQQRIIYSYFEGLFNQAFHLAKAKDFEASIKLFERGEIELSAHDRKSTFGSLLQETRYPKKAYYYYKINKVKPALFLTYKTIWANEHLKKTLGADFLVFIQIQQYHNIARILDVTKDFRSSMALIRNLLSFLLLARQVPLKCLESIRHDDENEKSMLICAMSYQIILDTLLSIYHMPKEDTQITRLTDFVHFIRGISSKFCSSNNHERVLKDFLYLISHLNLNYMAIYDRQLNSFIKENSIHLFPTTEKVLKMFGQKM